MLVVDDDSAIGLALGVRLRQAGLEVLICSSAHEAIERVGPGRPDLIVLDIDMPRFTGSEFHECLQTLPRTRNIPVIYLTGHDTELHRRVAAARGAKAFFRKPCDSAQLVAAIQTALG